LVELLYVAVAPAFHLCWTDFPVAVEACADCRDRYIDSE
jgi:hypothetical protein